MFRFKRSVFVALGVILASSTWPGPASAQLSTLVERCASAQSSPAETVNFCQRALADGGLSARAEAQVRTNLGIGFLELNRFNDARAELDRAIAAAPDLTAAYIYRARALERLGRLREAAADYATVLSRDPSSWQAYFGRGELLLAHGDPAAAERDFTAVLRLEPDLTAARFSRGLARYGLNAWQGAAEDFTAVIAVDPADAAAYLNRAQARAAGGDAGAITDYDQALALEPEWARAWFARGAYHEARRDREQANRDFMRAWELGFEDPWLNQRVREIRGG